ncbi:MAG: hypothetical protein IBX50_19390 [Marinospirillum sp.]|uniref:STY4851/ECs_5259 family protein n=1 Tax=Marinospirillum sp. TaxID=2183934 RepID=UPI0019F5E958|nr:STY4851/ECs_5259 family protein [Marinospirillum sp.]MBE0508854.1 hypothetical protein [Marinospirillum sp.]
MDSVSGKGQLKTFFVRFLEKRGTNQSKGIPLYQYSTKDTEFDMLAALLSLHHDEKDHPVFGLYWAAGFCLYVAEKFRREYDAKWSWQGFENTLELTLSPAERTRLVLNGLDVWQRPLRQRDNGQNDYLGSLFAEGGLPWSLLSNDQHGFGRAIKGGLKRYHEYRSSGRDLSQLMADYGEYFPTVFRNIEKYQLLAQVVESLMSLAERHQLNQQNDPAAYLNLYNPEWRDAFPLPLEADNGESLVNEWLKDAGTRLAERKQQEEKALYFTCLHRLVGHGALPDVLSTAQLEVEVQLAPLLDVDLGEVALNTTRIELSLYEGEQMLLRLGVSYGEVDGNRLRIRLPKERIRLRRKHPEQVLRLVCSSGGQILPNMEIQDSVIDWAGLPVVFEKQETELLLTGCASVKSKADTLLLHLPPNFQHDIVLSPLAETSFGRWYCVTEVVRISHNGSFFLIEPSSSQNQLSPVFRGAQCLESTLPVSAWKGWPHCVMSNNDGSHEPAAAYRINGKTLSSLINFNHYGALNVEVLGNEGQVIARRKLGVLPRDFRVTAIAASANTPARIVITTSAAMSYYLANDNVQFQQVSKAGEIHLLLDDKVGQHPERLLLEVTDPKISADPITIRIPYPLTGVTVLDAEGKPLKRNNLVLNQILGMTIWLRSAAIGQKTFHLVLELMGCGTPVRRVFRYTLSSNKPVEISLYSLYDEILSLLSCSDSQDAQVRLRIETSQLLRQLTIYRYAAELINSSSLTSAHPETNNQLIFG